MPTRNKRVPAPAKRLDFFERYLSIWVLAVHGYRRLLAGDCCLPLTHRLSALEFGHASHVSIPIAVLIWLMIYPMMLKIDFGGLKGVMRRPRGLAITLFVNWLVKPFGMAFLGWLFLRVLFGQSMGWISPDAARSYTAGLIILAAAPCTAMVFVWSYLTDGDSGLHAGAGCDQRPHHAGALCPYSDVPGWSDGRSGTA